MLRWLVLGLLGATLVACDDDVSQFVFEAQIVGGDDGNPVAGTDADSLQIGIAEGDLPIRNFDFPITDGQFEAVLEFASFSSITRIRVGMGGPATELITAPPAFVPTATFGFMKVVAAAPSSCTLVSFNAMQAPRASFGMVQSGTFALIAGGTETDTEEQIEFFDALEWESRLFSEDVSRPFLGETRAATIGEGKILVLPAQREASPFVFDMIDASKRITEIGLPNSVGGESALVSVPGVGAMVIGGAIGGEATADAFLVTPDLDIDSIALNQARAGAAAAAVGEDVLVVGGDETGSAELLFTASLTSEPVQIEPPDGVRIGGLLVGDGETRALLIGGTDASDEIRLDTLRFDGCPRSCTARTGPDWTTARLRAIVPEYTALVVGGDGSQGSLVEVVRWSDDAVAIEPLVQLNVPRAGAGAIVYESGAFVVAGGDDGSNARRDDFEFCVPASLEPL